MKLNTKRTVLVGFAFLSICAFWQVYDSVVPLMLKTDFGVSDSASGYVMALDNVLALFLLPFFGTLSDKCKSRFGRRTPFVVAGTLAAAVLMNLLPVAQRSGSLPLFVVSLLLLLVAMGTYRSPAVALMPDVTPKPLRSKGNAVINLMGALGGVISLGATALLVKPDAAGRNDYTALFLAVAGLMLLSAAVLALTVRERKLAEETARINDELDAQNPESAEEETDKRGFAALAPDVRRSLYLILFSVFFWFMGYNAVTSAFTKYALVRWGHDFGDASRCLLVATVAAVASYIPVGQLSARFGRKRMIQCGVALLALTFGACALFAEFSAALYALFALIGVAWATINVNSYPMVVEIARSGDVGKFTGYYYTFSMAAQIITPILSGYLLQYVGYHSLLPYAAGMVAISLVTISLTRHGDSRPTPPASALEAFDTPED